jgi:hypothetical protein
MSLVLTPKERARMKVVNDALKNGINPYEDVSKRHVISGVDRSLREVKIERDETVLRSNTEKVIIPDGEWGKGKHFRGIMPVSHIKGKVDETVKIGDTLFVNGVPHVECYHCKTPIRRFQIVERGGNMKADNYKITIGHWQRKDEYFVDENDQLCVR